MQLGTARATPAPTAIVDAHHHLWQLDRGHYPWLQEAYDPARFILGDYAALCADFGPREYLAAARQQPLLATVHVEAERDRAQALAESHWLQATHQVHGFPNAIVAWVDLLADDADAQLRAQAAVPLLRGVRCKPTTAASATAPGVSGQPGSLQDPRWPRALQRLHQHGLLWDLRVPFWHLAEAAALLAQVPELTVVLEHTGLPWDRSEAGLQRWRDGMQALARCPRVHVKLSEFGLRDQAWHVGDNARLVRETVDIFGPERCLFGSNFPVASLRISYAALVAAINDALGHLSAPERQAIWCDNALRVYRIERPAHPLETVSP
jgi:predicted TIM-barrel fold metal-dependent hydrolase